MFLGNVYELDGRAESWSKNPEYDGYPALRSNSDTSRAKSIDCYTTEKYSLTSLNHNLPNEIDIM